MSKGSFIIYDVDLKSIQYLEKEQVGRLFLALSAQRLDGVEPDFSDDAALKILFHQISEHIAINEEKYKAVCERNSKSAKKRWEKVKNKSVGTENPATECQGIQEDTKRCLYDTDTDTVTDTVTVTDTDACGAKRENKRKNYYNKKNDVPILLRDNPSYDIDAFTRKAIGIKYKKPEVSP